MQIKHTFLFTLFLGLAWTGFLFAYINGPDPAMNGIFGPQQTCSTAGCHTGNPVNSTSGNGSLTISGLPTVTGWTPGQTYALSVTIQRNGSNLFGFQLSAVADATNQQAGTLAAGNGRVQIRCGRGTAPGNVQVNCSTAGAIQYAEHSNAQLVTNTYLVNWTAPSSASVGTVRFNIAGNAANGNIQPDGDFIYTRVDKVDPAAVEPPPPPVDLSTRAFTMVDRGGVSVITDGSGDLSVGYSRIQPGAGSTTPSGVAIFGFRQGNTLVTEAGVPASVRLTSARIYAEVTGAVNTGLAIANPNDQQAVFNYHFTDAAGVDFGAGILNIPANQQTAKFLDQDPFSVLASRNPFQGTFSFTSNVEVSVVALRGLFNERTPSEFLITTLPVTNPTAAPGTGAVVLPHFADGGGWTTQIILVNPTDAALTGTVQFWSPGGATPAAPLTVTANNQTLSTFNYAIPRQSSFKLVTSGTPASTLSGSVRVTPATGGAPSSLVVFSFKQNGVTVSEAGAPGIQSSAFRMYAETTTKAATVGAIQTGFAIANVGATPTTVNLELTGLDGASTGQSASVDVPANGQVASFLHEKFPNLTLPFKGVMRITATAGLSVVGLRGRYNERGDFLITTTPASNESSPASATELLFPHLVNGGGYTTQFILFSGTAGQASSGNLKFFKQDGTPLNLTVN